MNSIWKFVVGVVVFLVIVIVGSGLFVDWVFEHDAKNAVEECRALGGEPTVYVGDGHYLCTTPDGRVLGRS